MHFERLVIEAGERTFSLPFAPRVTVIGGMGELEREGLLTELVTSLGPGRNGVHVDLTSDAGARYTIYRPADGKHRVVDNDTRHDVSEAFQTDLGTIDLLARAGLDVRAARRHMRVTPSELATRARDDHRIASLSRLDQYRLWEVAGKVEERQQRLTDEAKALGSGSEDAEAIAEIERRHQEFELAEAAHERARSRSFIGAALLTLAAMPLATLTTTAAAMALLAGALAVACYSFVAWRRLESARSAERSALATTGSDTYLSFHLERINKLMVDDLHRKALLHAAEDHRAAMKEWRVLAGEIGVEWAVEHRGEIRRAAATGSSPGSNNHPVVDELTAQMLGRLARLRQLGPGGESFPAIFDEAFAEIPDPDKLELLDRLLTASAGQQVVILTDDPTVVQWARDLGTRPDVKLLEPNTRKAPEGRSARRRVVASHLVA